MRWQKIICAFFAVLIAAVIIYPLFFHPMFHVPRAQRSTSQIGVIHFLGFMVPVRILPLVPPAGITGNAPVNARFVSSASVLELVCSLLC
jgi:hypothetical protein